MLDLGRARAPRLVALALLLAGLSACGPLIAWRGKVVSPPPAAKAVRSTGSAQPAGQALAPPGGVRPCCIFGSGVQLDVGTVEVPFVELENIVSVSDLGRHQYDNGSSPLAVDEKGVFAGEKNGLTFSCRTGFVDVAHVRDYADWTLFLAARMESCIDGGCVISLPSEGGDRYVVVRALPAALRARSRRLATVVALARWTAFQLSIWHEIATGSGWSAFEAFPELASAFSPEDLFSNALGTRIGGEIVARGVATSEGAYNEAMTAQLAATLTRLGAVSPEKTRAVLESLDGSWWDSSQRLPSTRLVRRRSFDVGPVLRPVELPRDVARKWCPKDRRRESIRMPSHVGGRRIGAYVTLFVEVARDERVRLPGKTPPWITQESFPELIRAVRAALAKEGVTGAPMRRARQPSPRRVR